MIQILLARDIHIARLQQWSFAALETEKQFDCGGELPLWRGGDSVKAFRIRGQAQIKIPHEIALSER